MNDLPRREFGRTGLMVSILGLGSAQVGGSQVSEADAERLLNGALDAGINLIDTARGYGLSEERIGKYLARRRNEYLISTKVGYGIPGHKDWTAGSVMGGIERALSQMRTDVLDIVHLHSCDLEVLRMGEVITALELARQSGKIRFAAYSGENTALDYAIATGSFQSVQFSVNLCDQRSIDGALAQAAQRSLGVIAKRPLANYFWRFEERPFGDYAEDYWLRAELMRLSPGELTWPEFVLRFAAFTPGVHSCITGTSSLDHLQENIRIVMQGPLPDAVYAQTRQAFRLADSGWVGLI
jgi:aryl-alcohol dehydrogenase-like predicted oxidoreductase